MRISIAMCTYNGSRFLNQQLQSIAAQKLPPCELVVCDDGSTDSTSHIVKSFAQSVTFPVSFIRNDATLGSTRNFEKAIRLCQGDAIALCDQDDVWHASKLDTMARVFVAETQVGGIFSDAGLIDESSQPLAGSLWQRSQFTPAMQADLNSTGGALLLLQRRVVTGATFAFRANLVPQVTPIPGEWMHDAWIALLIAAVSRLQTIPEHLVSYRLHATQQVGLTSRRWYSGLQVDRQRALVTHKQAEERWRSLVAKLKTLPVDPSLLRIAQERLAFMQDRTALRQQKMPDRVVGATLFLPKYFRFSQGLMSYGRDVAGA